MSEAFVFFLIIASLVAVEQLERDGIGEGRWSRSVLDAQEEAIAASELAEEAAARSEAAEDRHARWRRALEVVTLLFLGLALSFGMALVLIAFGRIS